MYDNMLYKSTGNVLLNNYFLVIFNFFIKFKITFFFLMESILYRLFESSTKYDNKAYV